MSESLGYRRAEDPDRAFIVNSWVSSFKLSHAAGVIPLSMYEPVYREAVGVVLERPGIEVWVAYHPGETDAIADLYGWICVERGHPSPLVHYTFVKAAFRRMGIARGLFDAVGIDPLTPFHFTFKTGLVTQLRRVIPLSTWDPLVARFPVPANGS